MSNVGRASWPVLVAVIAVFATTAGAQPTLPDLVGDLPADSQLIGCEHAEDAITVEHNSHLDPNCIYRQTVSVTTSDVVLDCRGATIDSGRDSGRGILVEAARGEVLRNVVVRNCIVRGFLNSIRVSREGFKDLPAGHEYEQATEDIAIENSRLFDSRGSGVFVNGYVTDVTLRDLEITGSGSVGIYLEAGSRGNRVERCDIHDNGYGDVTPEGVPFQIGGVAFRYLSTGREGIAIDGSRDNRIVGNRIARNSAGGIFLYKNCGEYVTQQPNQWWPRRYGANDNRILGNIISEEPNGVWIGSRMAENQVFLDCSDPAYVSSDLIRIHEDFARGNLVAGNTFVDVAHGVRVEDDGNRIVHNRFSGDSPSDHAILLGTQQRTRTLGRPVRDTLIRWNRADIVGNDHPYAWIHGHENTRFRRNRVGRLTLELVEGQQPRINPFLFVQEFWIAAVSSLLGEDGP